MAQTLQGTPIGGEARQRPLELHDGVDLEALDLDRADPRRAGPRRTWLAAGLVVLLVLSMAAWFLLARGSTPEPVPEQETVTAHDSGIARIVEERAEALESVHDSGIDRLIEDRAEVLGAVHDSGIELARRAR